MANSSRKKSGPTSSRGSHKIGHGNPPRDTQFAKGRSGNPKGRPKGSKNLSTIIMEAARDQVSATIDGKKRKITKLQATAMQMATLAASGKPQMVARFLDWIDEIEKRAAVAKPAEYPIGDADLEVIRAVHDRMKLCKPKEN